MAKVVGELNNEFGLKLADVDNSNKTLTVQLPAQFRDKFSPRRTPEVVNKVIVIVGTRKPYTGISGLKNVKSISLAAPEPSPNDGASTDGGLMLNARKFWRLPLSRYHASASTISIDVAVGVSLLVDFRRETI